MKSRSNRVKIQALAAVSALALYGVAFGSSAFADETATPTATISASPADSNSDTQSSDESDAQAVLDGSSLSLAVSTDLPSETDSVEPAEIDTEVEALDSENQQEADSFNQDITDAEQSGNQDDAVELGVAASIVTSVTAPEVTAMATDDTEAHAIITDVQK
jgi:hypothetical protein